MLAIHGAVWQSNLVLGLILAAILVTARRRKESSFFPVSVTQELKGLAILLVLFSHIGNFLIADHRFLSPFSGLSQVGVDMFLLLSGYGLSVSNLKRPQKPLVFYKRLLKLFIPFWVVLTAFLLIDHFALQRQYAGHIVLLDYLGIFLTSNLAQDINAPFWFITYITGYYLVFPWVFNRKRLWLSALAMFIIGAAVIALNPPVLRHIMFLYKLHAAAFPAGMLLAWWLHGRAKPAEITLPQRNLIRYGAMAVLVIGFALLDPASHNTQAAVLRQTVNLLGALLVIGLFICKRHDLRALNILGVYSFEFYLLHWPIISRYDQLYSRTPAWLATTLYLIIIMALGYGLQRLASTFDQKMVSKQR